MDNSDSADADLARCPAWQAEQVARRCVVLAHLLLREQSECFGVAHAAERRGELLAAVADLDSQLRRSYAGRRLDDHIRAASLTPTVEFAGDVQPSAFVAALEFGRGVLAGGTRADGLPPIAYEAGPALDAELRRLYAHLASERARVAESLSAPCHWSVARSPSDWDDCFGGFLGCDSGRAGDTLNKLKENRVVVEHLTTRSCRILLDTLTPDLSLAHDHYCARCVAAAEAKAVEKAKRRSGQKCGRTALQQRPKC